jgi:hypothetical protein
MESLPEPADVPPFFAADWQELTTLTTREIMVAKTKLRYVCLKLSLLNKAEKVQVYRKDPVGDARMLNKVEKVRVIKIVTPI